MFPDQKPELRGLFSALNEVTWWNKSENKAAEVN